MPLKLKGSQLPSGRDRRYYMIRVQVDGRRVAVSTGSNDEVDALAKERLIVAALHKNPRLAQADLVALIRGSGSNRCAAELHADGGLTLKEAFDRCLRSPTTWRYLKAHSEYARNCRVIEEILGADTKLSAIDYHSVQKLTSRLVSKPLPGINRPGQTLSGATVNNHLACLRRMFNVALDDHWPDAPKVFPKVKGVRKRTGRAYFMDFSDEQAIFEAVLNLDNIRLEPKWGHPRKPDAYRYHLLFVVLVESGMRLSEALGLLWTELDFSRGERAGMIELFRHEDLKTGRQRSVPMTDTCATALDACRGIAVGPFKDLDARRAQDIWRRARAAAGIGHRDCVIHSLRHTCASRLLESGADLKIVKEWLGHTSIATTDIYTHLQTKQLVSAAQSVTRLRQDAILLP
ncbi:site-specific recombinase XerD [Luteibacter sp. OK325]|uniref:tyrosine-type recombinase/integrase n=1 Tax=Luteibacter sp. OK325 TaxID=2135670 RepID=UPI000D366DE6|nr:tyrosine-type recombinase/integrase [Luteibacter sp. OK325]PTR33032.1 site-specific recombinase XerD [Luteibacter sp. OK325]